MEIYCEHDRNLTVQCISIKLSAGVTHDEKISPIDLQGQRSRS